MRNNLKLNVKRLNKKEFHSNNNSQLNITKDL